MIKLSSALADLIKQNTYLQWGLSHDVLNLTQIAHLIKHDLEVMTKKELKVTSIVMALSRIKESISTYPLVRFHPTSVSMITDLYMATYTRKGHTEHMLRDAHKLIHASHNFFTMTFGLREVTVAFPQGFKHLLRSIEEPPIYEDDGIGAISLGLPKDAEKTPGLLSIITQKIFTHGINIIEVASTTNEFVLLLKQDDLMRVYEILSRR